MLVCTCWALGWITSFQMLRIGIGRNQEPSSKSIGITSLITGMVYKEEKRTKERTKKNSLWISQLYFVPKGEDDF